MFSVFIEAGHGLGPGGAEDDGASFERTNERDEAVEIARETITLLEDRGVSVIPVGVTVRMSLKQKIDLINGICRQRGWQRRGVTLLSIHLNSASAQARGIEGWHLSGDVEGMRLAEGVAKAVSGETGMPYRSVKPDAENRHGRLGIVRDVIPTAALIECGFLTNELDRRIIEDPEKDDLIALGIAKGLCRYLGVNASWDKPAFYMDVPPEAWYRKDVELCVEKGVLIVPRDGLFHPTDDRVSMAVMMARHLRSSHA